ncbi:MAG: hypothetical protein U1A78_26820 [Polyangia bacterium]
MSDFYRRDEETFSVAGLTPIPYQAEGSRALDPQSGRIGYILLWLLGVPLPLLLIAYLIWGR